MTNQNDGLKYYTQDAINQIYPLTVLQVKIAHPGHSTPWLVIAVWCSPSCCRVTVPSCRTKEGAPSTPLSMGALPGTTSYLSLLCNRDSRSPHCVNYASTSQHLLTSCSSKLPEDNKSSSVYLHLKRRPALTSSKTSQSHHRIVSTTQWVYNFYSASHRCKERGWGPHFSESGTDFFFFGAKLRKNFEQGWLGGGGRGGWLRSKACKFLASGPNQPRGPRRGGETSASFLNWSHWDPQGSPRRTRRKALKIWPRGSDKELSGEKAKEKKDGFGGEKHREQRGTVGGEEPVEADQGETRKVGSFSEGASRQHCVPVKRQSRKDWHDQLSNPCNMSDDVLNRPSTGVS